MSNENTDWIRENKDGSRTLMRFKDGQWVEALETPFGYKLELQAIHLAGPEAAEQIYGGELSKALVRIAELEKRNNWLEGVLTNVTNQAVLDALKGGPK